MNAVRTLLARLRLLFHREAADREATEEFSFHLDMEAARLVGQGVSPQEARRQARIRFGSVTEHREALRDGQRIPLVETMVRDTRYTLRALRRAPAFTGAVVLTLGLGVGAAAAVFTVVDGVLLRPLPFVDSDRLHTLWSDYGDGRTLGLTEPEALEIPGRIPAISAMGVWARGPFNLVDAGDPEQVTGAVVSAGAFAALGTAPALGRVFGRAEDAPGRDAVVVLSHRLWQRRYGGDAAVLGRTVRLDGRVRTVVGVMPADFRFPDAATELWVPRALDAAALDRSSRYLRAVVRLEDGADAAAVEAELDALASVLTDEIPARYGSRNNADGFSLVPLHELLTGDVRPILLLLLAGVILVLLVACANVANLMLARQERRRHELAVRAALGGGQRRLMALTLTESLVLATLGGAVALPLAWAGVGAFTVLAPAGFPRVAEVSVDGSTAAAMTITLVLVGLVFAVATALAARRAVPADALARRSRGGTEGPAARRFRRALVVAQLALSLALLGGAGLLLRTLDALAAESTGIVATDVLTGRLFLAAADYPADGRVLGALVDLQERVGAEPAVVAAALVTTLPMSGGRNIVGWRLPGEEGPQDEDPPQALHLSVTPDYLAVLGIPLLAGRDLRWSDAAGERVVLVSEAFAEEAWPGEPAVGRRLHLGGADTLLHTVVGVVGDVRHHGPGTAAPPTVYFPPRAYPWGGMARGYYLVARTEGAAAAAVPGVRRAVAEVDRTLPLADVQSLEAVVRSATVRPRLATTLLGGFAMVGLVMAAAGVYGVLAYAVARRTREMGIRMALGAAPAQVRREVLGEVGLLVMAGIGGGALLFAGGAVFLKRLLYGVAPADPPALLGAVALLAGAAFLAGFGPALRAGRVDPARCLRDE